MNFIKGVAEFVLPCYPNMDRVALARRVILWWRQDRLRANGLQREASTYK
jgi:hypothetical protein